MQETSFESVSDTARWVAIFRATESERPDALFRDPFARELGGKQGEAMVRSLRWGERIGWGVAIRTKVIDDWLTRLVREDGIDLVVNLAAGLDTRPFRLDLPKSLVWVEADLPSLNSYKNNKMHFKVPVCDLQRYDVDLSQAWARNQFFEKLNERYSKKRAVVLTEGLLMYLSEANVLELVASINSLIPARYWIQDYLSPSVRRGLNRLWADQFYRSKTYLRFSPTAGPDYFKPFSWTVEDSRSLFLEGIRLNRRPPFSPFLKFIYDLLPPNFEKQARNLAGLALLRKSN